MEIQKNKFKQNIQSGDLQIGVWNGLPDNYVAEILAGSGYDWILIDGEHAPFDLRTILQQMQAIAQFGVPVIVRPPVGDPVLIKQLLEAGVQTLLIPMVDDAEEAALAYRSMHYPPVGIRGVGTAMSRGAQWNRVNDYFKVAGDEMCLIVQVENASGLKNLDKILKTEGVEGIFIGPSDLAASLGFLGQPDHPEVKEKIEIALKKIRKAGKVAGIMATSKPLADHYIACGANMVAVGIDALLLAKAAKDNVASFKKELIGNQSNTKY
jgi:4-hydroxy-2-oxoheptanedioate aldolase